MLSGKSSKKRNSVANQEPSKVLLVCIYDTIALDITNEIVYEKFRHYGNIVRLLIFEKNEVTKLFVEYSDLHQAYQARNDLDGAKLYGNICKMSIYFSNFNNVDLKNETSQGADYSESERENNLFVHRYDELTRSSPEEDTEDFNDLIMQSFDPSPLARSKTDNSYFLSSYTSKINHNAETQSEENQIQKQIRSNINSILESNSTSSQHPDENTSFASTPSKTNQSFIPIKETSKSKTTALSFRYERDMEVREVYNLFSNFGNIACIIKKKDEFFIKFRSLEFASISYTYLNGYTLMGNTLLLESPSDEEATPNEHQWSECVHFDPSFDRFTAQKSITINSPSVTLHVSSLKKDACNEQTLMEVFEEQGEVANIHILKQSADKNMALVRFYSIEDSFRAIATLHNSILAGRKMQISFTKSRT